MITDKERRGTVTAIEQQKKNTARYSVFINGKFAFGLSGTDVLYYKLEAGIELSNEKYNKIIEECIFAKARDKAVRFLSYRARSQKEVFDKLAAAEDGFSAEIIDRVIAQMARYGYIDDAQFARAFISEKRKLNGFGEIRLRHALTEKGIRGDIIENALAEQPQNAAEAALTLLEKKYKAGKCADQKERKKACDFLLRKGYSYEIIKEAMDLFDKQEDLY
jgi:regulatory protein